MNHTSRMTYVAAVASSLPVALDWLARADLPASTLSQLKLLVVTGDGFALEGKYYEASNYYRSVVTLLGDLDKSVVVS